MLSIVKVKWSVSPYVFVHLTFVRLNSSSARHFLPLFLFTLIFSQAVSLLGLFNILCPFLSSAILYAML